MGKGENASFRTGTQKKERERTLNPPQTIHPPVHRVDHAIHARVPVPELAPLALPGAGEVLKRDERVVALHLFREVEACNVIGMQVGLGREREEEGVEEERKTKPMRKSSLRPCSSVRSSAEGWINRPSSTRKTPPGWRSCRGGS
jgi:hypothetical protein